MTKDAQGQGVVKFIEVYEGDIGPVMACTFRPFLALHDAVWQQVLEEMESDFVEVLEETQSLCEADRKAYMKSALLGIKTLHDRGIIHGDIKPRNFLYSYSRNQCSDTDSTLPLKSFVEGLKLADFGSAIKADKPKAYPTTVWVFFGVNMVMSLFSSTTLWIIARLS